MKRNIHEFGDNWHLFLPWIPVVISLFYLWGVILMNLDIVSTIIGGAVTLVVAFFTTFAVQLSESRQMKKDGESIKETKNMVSDTKPIIGVIHANTETVKSDIEHIDERTQVIATEIMNFRNLQQEKAGNIDAGAILASVSAALQDYASLKRKLEESESNVQRLTQENERLSSRNRFLEQQLNQSQEPDWEMEP